MNDDETRHYRRHTTIFNANKETKRRLEGSPSPYPLPLAAARALLPRTGTLASQTRLGRHAAEAHAVPLARGVIQARLDVVVDPASRLDESRLHVGSALGTGL